MQTDWDGYYLDGRTAARQRATIHLMPDGLQITTENGTVQRWPYAEMRQTQGFYVGEPVRLEREGEPPEVLIVSDTAFLSAMRRMAPQRARRFHDPAIRGRRITLTALAAVIVIASAVALYMWGIPALVAFATPHIPVSWEEQLGKVVVEHLAPPEKQCTDPTRVQMLNDLITTLTAPLPSVPYTFRVIVVDDDTVNALAAPGGYIVLFRGLLEKTQSPEELAGVLAHEMQHILHRHGTQALLQDISTGLLVGFIIGDVSGLMAFGLEGARLLTMLRYSRQSEEEADREGMQMIRAAEIDPAGMITFFEAMKKQEADVPAVLTYLSTHPDTEARIEKLRALAAQAQQQSIKLLPDYGWREIDKICQAAGR